MAARREGEAPCDRGLLTPLSESVLYSRTTPRRAHARERKSRKGATAGHEHPLRDPASLRGESRWPERRRNHLPPSTALEAPAGGEARAFHIARRPTIRTLVRLEHSLPLFALLLPVKPHPSRFRVPGRWLNPVALLERRGVDEQESPLRETAFRYGSQRRELVTTPPMSL